MRLWLVNSDWSDLHPVASSMYNIPHGDVWYAPPIMYSRIMITIRKQCVQRHYVAQNPSAAHVKIHIREKTTILHSSTLLVRFTLETMAVRSEQSADIHDTNRRQSGTALFRVRGSVGHTWHRLSNSVLALHSSQARRHQNSCSRSHRQGLFVTGPSRGRTWWYRRSLPSQVLLFLEDRTKLRPISSRQIITFLSHPIPSRGIGMN